jgi:hypothetical protein
MSQIQTLKLVHGRNKSTTCDVFLFGATVISWKVSGFQSDREQRDQIGNFFKNFPINNLLRD